jgi:hypothetical protein
MIMGKKKMQSYEDSEEKRIKVSTLAWLVVVLFAIVSLVVCVLVYGTRSQAGENISSIFSKILPMPAAVINMDNFVMLGDLEKNTAALVKFYQSPGYLQSGGLKYDFSTSDGKKQIEIMKQYVLNKMIEDKAVEILAAKRNITVSPSDIKNFMNGEMKAYATQNDVAKMLVDSYGWTIDDFTNRVVIPSVRMATLQNEVTKNEINNDAAKNKIAAAQAALSSGADFAAVAKQYSEGESKDNGGELGWVAKSKMIPELQNAIFGQNQPKETDIIESSLGYHLIDIEGQKKENNEDVVQFKQIFVAKETFSNWLADQMKNMHIMIPLGEFSWNSNDESVDFADKNMQQFEQGQTSSPTGIMSTMFR